VVTGNLLDFEAVRNGLEGVQGAYFVYPIMPGLLQATAYFAQAAKEVELSAIVNMSQISARREARSHAAQDHWIAERIFDWSGIPTTHLRPTLFAEWALYWTDQIKTGTLRLPFGTGRHAPITAEDQARVITNILLAPEQHKGKIYPLYGEREYTFAEIAGEIGKVIGKPLAYEQIDAWELKQLAGRSGAVPEDSGNSHRRRDFYTDTLWQRDSQGPSERSLRRHKRPCAADRWQVSHQLSGIPSNTPQRLPRLEQGNYCNEGRSSGTASAASSRNNTRNRGQSILSGFSHQPITLPLDSRFPDPGF
jgi:uncharacterized protein YbjT (DUF2867 family)